MPEQFNISCVLKKRLVDRRDAISELIATRPAWIGRALQVVIFDQDRIILQEPFSAALNSTINRSLSKGQFLFVYCLVETASGPLRTSLGVSENGDCSTYTINIPRSILRDISPAEVAESLLEVHKVCAALGPSYLLAGLEIDSPFGACELKAISTALEQNSTIDWILVNNSYVSHLLSQFSIVVRRQKSVLLHRRQGGE